MSYEIEQEGSKFLIPRDNPPQPYTQPLAVDNMLTLTALLATAWNAGVGAMWSLLPEVHSELQEAVRSGNPYPLARVMGWELEHDRQSRDIIGIKLNKDRWSGGRWISALEAMAPLVSDGSFVALSGEDGWSLRIEFYAGRSQRVELVGSNQFPSFSRELRAGEFFVYHCVNPLQMVVPNADYWRTNWATDLYRLVAKVSAQDPEGAWQVTQHIDGDWRGNPAVEPLTQTQVRSSAVGDVIVAAGGECYMAMMQGWLKL